MDHWYKPTEKWLIFFSDGFVFETVHDCSLKVALYRAAKRFAGEVESEDVIESFRRAMTGFDGIKDVEQLIELYHQYFWARISAIYITADTVFVNKLSNMRGR